MLITILKKFAREGHREIGQDLVGNVESRRFLDRKYFKQLLYFQRCEKIHSYIIPWQISEFCSFIIRSKGEKSQIGIFLNPIISMAIFKAYF